MASIHDDAARRQILGQVQCQMDPVHSAVDVKRQMEIDLLRKTGALQERLMEFAKKEILVEGVGPDAPIVTNDLGGKQSFTPYRADLLPPLSLLAIAKVLQRGAVKYGENNWHKTTIAENVNHAYVHLLCYLAGDKTDDHLEHSLCRMMFAMELKIREEKNVQSSPDQSAGLGSVGCGGQDVGCHQGAVHSDQGPSGPGPGG